MAARAGAPYEREFLKYSVFNLVRKLLVKMNLFFEQGGNAMNTEGTISRNHAHCCSEEARKMT